MILLLILLNGFGSERFQRLEAYQIFRFLFRERLLEFRFFLEQLLELLEIHEVKFVWIKGHAGFEENERCDRLAVVERNKRVVG